MAKDTRIRYRSSANAMLMMYSQWDSNLMSSLAKNKFFPSWAKQLQAVKLIINSNTCSKRGHEWVDNSYGGPESGCMSAECTRCGLSHSTQLY